MIRDVQETTGITAAAGIGTNLYLCKVAMDIGAKHAAPEMMKFPRLALKHHNESASGCQYPKNGFFLGFSRFRNVIPPPIPSSL